MAHRAGAGRATSVSMPITLAAMPKKDARWRFARRRCFPRSRAWARAVSGVQSVIGPSTRRHSSTQRSSFQSRFSIFPHVFLAKRLLCAANESADRGGIEIECGGDLRVTETVGSEQQQFGLRESSDVNIRVTRWLCSEAARPSSGVRDEPGAALLSCREFLACFRTSSRARRTAVRYSHPPSLPFCSSGGFRQNFQKTSFFCRAQRPPKWRAVRRQQGPPREPDRERP